jgi:hypothetical protein
MKRAYVRQSKPLEGEEEEEEIVVKKKCLYQPREVIYPIEEHQFIFPCELLPQFSSGLWSFRDLWAFHSTCRSLRGYWWERCEELMERAVTVCQWLYHRSGGEAQYFRHLQRFDVMFFVVKLIQSIQSILPYADDAFNCACCERSYFADGTDYTHVLSVYELLEKHAKMDMSGVKKDSGDVVVLRDRSVLESIARYSAIVMGWHLCIDDDGSWATIESRKQWARYNSAIRFRLCGTDRCCDPFDPEQGEEGENGHLYIQ